MKGRADGGSLRYTPIMEAVVIIVVVGAVLVDVLRRRPPCPALPPPRSFEVDLRDRSH